MRTIVFGTSVDFCFKFLVSNYPVIGGPIPAKKHAPITSAASGGFTDELAKLAQDIEKEKAEIAKMEGKEKDKSKEERSANPSLVKGFQGLPNSISSILFGSEQKKPEPESTLSKMSDADLLAMAQESLVQEEAAPPPKQQQQPKQQEQQPQQHQGGWSGWQDQQQPPRHQQPPPPGPWMQPVQPQWHARPPPPGQYQPPGGDWESSRGRGFPRGHMGRGGGGGGWGGRGNRGFNNRGGPGFRPRGVGGQPAGGDGDGTPTYDE